MAELTEQLTVLVSPVLKARVAMASNCRRMGQGEWIRQVLDRAAAAVEREMARRGTE